MWQVRYTPYRQVLYCSTHKNIVVALSRVKPQKRGLDLTNRKS